MILLFLLRDAYTSHNSHYTPLFSKIDKYWRKKKDTGSLYVTS